MALAARVDGPAVRPEYGIHDARMNSAHHQIPNRVGAPACADEDCRVLMGASADDRLLLVVHTDQSYGAI